MRTVLSAVLVGAVVLAGLVVLAMAALWQWQERLIFQPTRLPPSHRFEHLGPDVQERWLDVPGARLHALHLRLPAPDGLVLYLHGNAGSLANWFVDPGFYRALNVDLLMVDYRGYGKSSGRIHSQAQLLADVQAVWQLGREAAAGRPVVLAGRSLGSGLALQLAAILPAEQRPSLLLLVSPYSSLQALAALHYPLVPGALLRYPLRSDEAMTALAQRPPPLPTVLLHGRADALIPLAHSQALARLQPGAQLVPIDGAGHNDLQSFPVYLDAVRAAIRQGVAAPR